MKLQSLFSIAAILSGSMFLTLGAFEKTQDAEGDQFPAPVEKDVEGWKVRVEEAFLKKDPKLAEQCLAALTNHLQRVKFIVSEKRLVELQRLPIWLELKNPSLENMQYHPNVGWLKAHGHDPRLAKHVHIPRAKELLSRQQWAKHPYVVLHELAHAYHDQVLGFNHPDIARVFESAKSKGIYKRVLAHNGKQVSHYGLNNPKEYFAEMTEAYLGVNDFYPFVRAELRNHDPEMYSLMEKIWGPID